MKNTDECSYIVRSHKVTWFVRFHLVNYANTPYPFHYGDHIATKIAASRGQCHLIETGQLVRAGDNFFPLLSRDFVSDTRVLLKKSNDFEPGDCD